MVIAKSLSSVKASNPKMAFSCCTALVFLEVMSWSILSMMALMLATQSEGANFWIGSYLTDKMPFSSWCWMSPYATLPLGILQLSLNSTATCNAPKQDIPIGLDRKCSLGACQASTI